MVQNPFIGTWRLIRDEVKSADGKLSYPYSKDAVGYISYNEDGYVFVAVMSANRPRYASERFRGATNEEKVNAADTYFSYCGTYEIQGNTVIHHIEVGLFPNFVGSSLKRTFSFNGDRLTLRTPALTGDGIKGNQCMIWKRV